MLVPTLGVVIALWLDLSPDIRPLLMIAIRPGGLGPTVCSVSRGNPVFGRRANAGFLDLAVSYAALGGSVLHAVGVARIAFRGCDYVAASRVPCSAAGGAAEVIQEAGTESWSVSWAGMSDRDSRREGWRRQDKTHRIESMGAGDSQHHFRSSSLGDRWLMGAGRRSETRKALAIAPPVCACVRWMLPHRRHYFPATDSDCSILAFSGISIPMI